MINFISNLPHDLLSGGFSAMNAAAYQALSKVETVHYVGPINPSPRIFNKMLSKSFRTCGRQGEFFFFSHSRLQNIAEEVHNKSSVKARLDFFHGFTPWIMTKPPRPYIAWSDCTFRDYIDIYHKRESFRSADLSRIEQAEAAWLHKAQCVAFTSQWAAKRAVEDYGLSPSRVRSVGIFGATEMPQTDKYAGQKQFLFVSTNFEAKGGSTVVSAFRNVRRDHREAKLVIVGARPSESTSEPGVTVVGFLRKEDSVENAKLREILSQSLAVVHPTKSDITPIILIEAAYFGCPAIASRRFGIPELANHGVTALLLDEVSTATVTEAMTWLLEHAGEYRAMRKHAWDNARKNNSHAAFERRLQACL